MRPSVSTLIVIAVIIIAFATVVISSVLSAGNPQESHRMPNGETMQEDRIP